VLAANVSGQIPLPQDGVIQVAFDRYLNPLTANRQGVTLLDENGFVPGGPPIVQYDPVARMVTISNPTPGKPWLVVGQFYKVVFPVATDEAGSFGLRSIDDATIDPSTKAITFQVAAPTGSPPTLPTIDFCTDVFPIFAARRASTTATKGVCTNAACHAAGGTAAQGLVLETPDDIRRTAIGVQAVETTTAALSTPLPPQPAFPVGMPIVDPGDPGDSYLLYKMLLPDQNGVPSADGVSVPYTACRPVTAPFFYGPGAGFASADEQARLAAHVVGRRMPWGDWDDATHSFGSGGGTPLTFDELERIRLWIQEGAEVDDCSNCPATLP
jgi:hypothetical protein